MQNNQYATNNILAEDIEGRIPNTSASSNNATGGVKFSEDNYLNTKLANGEQKRVVNIRLLPIDGRFCVEVTTHGMKVPYDIAKSGYKSFLCLNDPRNPNYDPNVKCPLCAKGDELCHASWDAQARGDKALADSLMEQAKPFFRKTTYIFRVIDRGLEGQGVKFWRFNGRNDKKDPYNELLSLYEINKQEALKYQGIQNYNIFDVYQGRDITLTLNLDKKGNRTYTAVSVSVSSYMTPLSQSQEQANMWLNDPKKWTDVYTHKPAEYLQIISEGLVPKFNPDTQRYEGVAPKNVQTPSASQQQAVLQQPMVPQQGYPQQGQVYQQQTPVAPQPQYAPQATPMPQQPYSNPSPAPAPQQGYQQPPQQGYPQPPQPQGQPMPQYPPQQMPPQGYPQPTNGNGYQPMPGQPS